MMGIDSTNKKTLKPLGDLSLFPREIRDEIYRHVFPKKYKAFYSSSIVRPTVLKQTDLQAVHFSMYHDWTASNLSILRLSKAIKDEAMPILYSEGTFRFYYGLGPQYPKEVPQLPNIDITNRMTNVEIVYDAQLDPHMDPEADSYLEWDASNCYGCAPAGPLEFFQGVTISRKSILIELRGCSFGVYLATKVTGSPLSRSLRQVTGFKDVTLRLATNKGVYCPAKWTSKAQGKEWIDAGEWEKLYAGFIPLFRAMSKNLEPALGKSSAMSELEPGESSSRLSSSGQRHIVFHPRDHQATISKQGDKTKKDPMSDEQSMSNTELNR